MSNKEISVIEKLNSSYPGFYAIMDIIKTCDSLDFYVAGGVVRNLLRNLNSPIKDIDIFVKGTHFNDFVGELIKIGKNELTPFGSLRWRHQDSINMSFDIVHFEDMAVLTEKPSNIIELLNQFDISVNAIAIDLKTKQLINPLNGLQDLENNLIRIIRFDFKDENVSASCPISPLSMLWFRTIHYASKYNFEIEAHTLLWLKENEYREKYLPAFTSHFFEPDLSTLQLLKEM